MWHVVITGTILASYNFFTQCLGGSFSSLLHFEMGFALATLSLTCCIVAATAGTIASVNRDSASISSDIVVGVGEKLLRSSRDITPGAHRPKRKTSDPWSQLDNDTCDKDELAIPNNPPCFYEPEYPGVPKTSNPGDTVTLLCRSYHFDEISQNTTWNKDNQPVIETSKIRITNKGDNFTINNVTSEDSGNYTCVICRQVGCINRTFEINVTAKVRVMYPGEVMNRDIDHYPDLTTRITASESSISYSPKSELRVSPEPDEQKIDETNRTESSPGPSKENTTSSSNSTLYVVGIVVVITLVCILSSTAIIFYCRKRRKVKKSPDPETDTAGVVTESTRRMEGEKLLLVDNLAYDKERVYMPVVKTVKVPSTPTSEYPDLGSTFDYEFSTDTIWELPRESLVPGEILGEGAFGRVVRAQCNAPNPGIPRVVAVKMLKEGHSKEDMKSLLMEKEIMKIIGRHVNIINLIGVCTQGGPLYVVVEFAPHGNLRDFLRKRRPLSGYESTIERDTQEERETLTQKDFVSFASQIARGMEYLASRGCIHRDLAARNILVADESVLKIADFGLARDVLGHDYYRKMTDTKLPIKWMAPETLFDRVYTTQSDVWSYGILLWELVTFGGTPYPSVQGGEQLFDLLQNGYRMKKPPFCSIGMYAMMTNCWKNSPILRPTFSRLVEDLDKILATTDDEEYLDMSLPQRETPPLQQDDRLQLAIDDEDNEVIFEDSRSSIVIEMQEMKNKSTSYLTMFK